VPLASGQSVRFDLAIEHVAGSAIAAARQRIAASAVAAVTHPQPKAGWSRT
jgi:hypothetical protein